MNSEIAVRVALHLNSYHKLTIDLSINTVFNLYEKSHIKLTINIVQKNIMKVYIH